MAQHSHGWCVCMRKAHGAELCDARSTMLVPCTTSMAAPGRVASHHAACAAASEPAPTPCHGARAVSVRSAHGRWLCIWQFSHTMCYFQSSLSAPIPPGCCKGCQQSSQLSQDASQAGKASCQHTTAACRPFPLKCWAGWGAAPSSKCRP